MRNAETAHGRHTNPERGSTEPAPQESALCETSRSPLQPFLQLVSGSAAFHGSAVFSRNENSITSGRPVDRARALREGHNTEPTVSASNRARRDTWDLLQALPTLAESPLPASDLRAEHHRHSVLPEPDEGPREPTPNRADPQVHPTAPDSNTRSRPRRFRPAAALRFGLVMISISLIAAGLVLTAWSLLRQPNPNPLGGVNIEAVAIAAMNR